MDFGPRVKFSKPQSSLESKENVPAVSNIAVAPVKGTGASTPRRGSIDPSGEQVNSSLAMKLDIANSRIAQVEKERDEWRQRAEHALEHSEGNLGDMLVEIELETLREEVSRLRSKEGASNETIELSSLRLRCAELETQVNTLKREKALLERKSKDDRNAEISKIRTLQDQISNEKKLRERIANTESALPVVTVGGSQSVIDPQTIVTAKPRAPSPAVPSFVVENASAAKRPPMIDPKSLEKTTVVLPSMARGVADSLGDDALGEQWKKCLSERPDGYRTLVARQPGTNIFTFGTHRVACKKIGNHTMIQVGRETMLLEKFLDTYGPHECTPKSNSCVTPKQPVTSAASVTLKSITASKHALVNKPLNN